jgi:tetratricopeptide (TPR) repeat protein
VPAVAIYQEWTQSYPRDNMARDNLSLTYRMVGQYEKALEQSSGALQNDPKDFYTVMNMTRTYICLNRFHEA